MPLGLGLVVLVHRNVVERDAVELRQRPRLGVVAHDQRDGAGEFAGLVAVEQVHQAVQVAGHEDRHRGAGRRVLHPPAHSEALGDGLELARQILAGSRSKSVQVPLDPHEEQPQVVVLVLIGVEDVGAVGVQKVRDGGDNPLPVGAVYE